MQLTGQHIHKFGKTTWLVDTDESEFSAKLPGAYATELAHTATPDRFDRYSLPCAEIAAGWNHAADFTDQLMSRTNGRDMAVPVPMKIGATDATSDDGEAYLTGRQ